MLFRSLAAALLLAAAVPAAPARTLGTLAFTPCALSSPMVPAAVQAQCAWLKVPENPALPQGRMLALRIALVAPDPNAPVSDDPVFMLAGGPGQSALDSYPQVAPAFAEVLKKRNVILVDQRGTGASHPLQCKDPLEGMEGDSAQAAADYASRCKAQLERDADLRQYTTGRAIADLDAVRAAIGAQTIDLVGISYGTRVAQQYAMHYPQHTRALVLDGVAPNALVLGNEFAANLEHALAQQFAQCSKAPDCARTLGDPRAQLDALLTRLRASPVQVNYRDAITGQMRSGTLSAGDVIGLVRMSAYMPLMSATLPLQFAEAAQGRYDTLAAAAHMVGNSVADTMAFGMQLSVICSEDADGLAADPAQEHSLLGNAVVQGLKAQCAVWPKGERAADFRTPLTGKVPTLLLSGEFDPVTPPRYAQQVASHLSNARSLVLRGQGHNVIAVGCTPRLLGRFLDRPDPRQLDATCLDKLAYVPAFTGFYGWDP